MGVINVLDKHVAELIAAGEVVERPASVIKELVENAIDAGAKHITVEIKNGGTTFMRVADDGCGISREDVRIAFLRHATSKVKVEADLDSIATLGFRGEALASICAVSRLRLITRNEAEEIGTTYEINGGEEQSLEDAGCPVGTTFIIKDLFYNIPARAKFLKKDVSEGNAVSNIIDKTALSHPEIAFTYIKDGKQMLKTFGDGKLKSAIYSVYGRDFSNGLIPVEYRLDSIYVKGYICKPINAKPNRNMQIFFINGRYVKSRTAMAALEEAFKGSIMVGKFPSCVLQLELPYEIIDVNVHPAKIEVRFINERPVFDCIYHAVKSSLLQNDTRKAAEFKASQSFVSDSHRFNPFNNAPAILPKEEKPVATPVILNPPVKEEKKDEFNPFDFIEFDKPKDTQKKPLIDEAGVSDSDTPFSIYTKEAIKASKSEEHIKHETNVSSLFVNDNKSGSETPNKSKVEQSIISPAVEESEIENAQNLKVNTESVVSQIEPRKLIEDEEIALRYIGEAFNTYIIVEKNNKEMLIVDKHAAHERIIYEKLKAEHGAGFLQMLLQPVTVTLSKTEYDAAVNNLQMFSDCAFEVEDFGEGTLLVRSAPQYLDAYEVADCIEEMAEYISSGKKDIYSEKMDWFYHNVACRSAIKAGNRSTQAELMDIVRQLEKNPEIRYCPHGRPVCIIMTKNEIEKQFGRM